jgi:hypothetical protein
MTRDADGSPRWTRSSAEIRRHAEWTEAARGLHRSHPQGGGMNARRKVVAHSVAAATVISILVSVVGAGTKWMGHS